MDRSLDISALKVGCNSQVLFIISNLLINRARGEFEDQLLTCSKTIIEKIAQLVKASIQYSKVLGLIPGQHI